MSVKKRWISCIICLLFMVRVPLMSVSAEDAELTLYARSAVLIDGDSGRILYGKECDVPLPMASTTKIMTCILALELGEPAQICSVSENAAGQPKVRLGMRAGQRFYLRDLLYSLMLESHNDSAVCVAEAVCGSVSAFSEKMNRKAEEIGCSDTFFITPNGLDSEKGKRIHHTTANDLAHMMRYCIRQSEKAEEFLEITQTASYSFTDLSEKHTYSCSNHNAFLTMMDGALSGKTGFTAQAGYCYTGALERDGRLYIVALLGCGWPGNKSYKWSDTRKLMEYGLNNFQKGIVTSDDMESDRAAVKNGQKSWVQTGICKKTVQILMRKGERVTSETEMKRELEAPVEKGEEIGRVHFYLQDQEVMDSPIVTCEAVKHVNFIFYLTELARICLFKDR